MNPIHLDNDLIRYFSKDQFDEIAWDNYENTHYIFGIYPEKKIEHLDSSNLPTGLPDGVAQIAIINREGGEIIGSFNETISHPKDQLKLKIAFSYQASFTPEEVSPFVNYWLLNSSKYFGDFKVLFQKSILSQYEYFLSTKISHGINIFDSFFDLKDEALTYTQDQLTLKLNHKVNVEIKVEGEDKVEDIKIIQEQIHLNYKNEPTNYRALVNANLTIKPEVKARAVALHDRVLPMRDKAIAKIVDFIGENGDLEVMLDMNWEEFEERLLVKLNSFLGFLGRICSEVKLNLPFPLPPKIWKNELDIEINTFSDVEQQIIFIEFEAELDDLPVAIVHQGKIKLETLKEMITEMATPLWATRGVQSVMLNHEYEAKELSQLISIRIQELGYQLTNLSLKFDTNLPQKEERLLLEWKNNYSLQGGKAHLPIKVKLNGTIKNLDPWEGILTKDFNLNQWLKSSFESEFEQYIRLLPSYFGIFNEEENSFEELKNKLNSIILQISEQQGIEIHNSQIQILDSPYISQISNLTSGLRSFFLNAIAKEREFSFLIEFQIKEVCKDHWDAFSSIAKEKVGNIAQLLGSFLKRRVQLALNQFVLMYTETPEIPFDALESFKESFLIPQLGAITLAYGLTLDQISVIQIEAESETLEREARIKQIKKRKQFLVSNTEKYEKFIQKDLENNMRDLDEINRNPIHYSEEATDVIHGKIRSLLKNYGRLLDNPEINQEG